MQINITWDASVANAPAGYKAAVQAAVTYLEQVLSAPITVNIAFGWGEVEGQALPAGSIGSSLSSGYALTYQEFRNALWSHATTADSLAAAQALPASDPTHGGTFYIASAEAKALGLADPTDTGIDGYVGLDSTTSFTFDPNNRAQPGLVDAIGALEHEITEVLGRTSYLGYQPGDGSSLYGALDLFRYTAPGVLNPSSATGSFSVNGQTLLLPFDNPINGGDSGDWSQTVTGDSFDAFGGPNEADLISATDLRVMDVLGYHPVAPAPTTPTPTGPTGTPIDQTQSAQVTAGQTLNLQDAATDGVRPFTGVTLEVATPGQQPPSFTNAGSIWVDETGSIAVVGVMDRTSFGSGGDFAASTFTNTATGAIYVNGSQAIGFESNQNQFNSSAFDNAGLIQVVATTGGAMGYYGEGNGYSHPTQVTNEATGRLIVSGASAFGIVVPQGYATAVNNAGIISVTATSVYGYAIGVLGVGSLNNSGTIQVTGQGQIPSVAIDWDYPSGGTFTNSGVIIGDYAFGKLSPFGDTSPAYNVDMTITNSGRIVGAIVLPTGNQVINNTGTIAGDIYFDAGTAQYNGAGGQLFGAIYLGLGNNTVTLGNNGGIVYGGNGADHVTGGGGDDVFEIARGDNVFSGGGGFNTVSFADSAAIVTVDLAAGTATAAGNDTLSGVQRLIGGNNETTFKAGSTAAQLIAGNGHATLVGGAGADLLVAGAGGATMTGGGGADTFVYSAGDHQVVITDFAAGDTLDIYGYSAPLSVTHQGSDTLITLSSTDTILLKGVQALPASGITYSSVPFGQIFAPTSPPVFGSSTVDVTQALTIAPGEVLKSDGHVYEIYIDVPVFGRGQPLSTIDNFGSVIISNNKDSAIAFEASTQGFGGNLINEAGALISASSQDFMAIGLDGPSFSPAFTNAGAVQVHSGMFEAYGVRTWDNSPVTNTATGSITVDGNEFTVGLDLNNGGVVSNAGSITATGTGAGAVYAVRIGRFEDYYSSSDNSFSNSGVIKAVADGTGHAYGVAVSGGDTIKWQTSFVNSGTIIAQTAIWDYDNGSDPGGAPSIYIRNTGTIQGDISLAGSQSTLVSTGSITGNILLQDGNGWAYYGVSTGVGKGDLVDLRGGLFQGDILVSPGLNAGLAVVSDTIYTGANSTTVKVAGGEATLALSVTADVDNAVTIQLDIASTAATERHNADGTWTVHAGTDGTLTLTHVQTLVFTDKTVTLTAAVAAPAADDFNGDGKSDFLIQNGSGAVVTGQIGGGQTAYAQVAALGSEWSFVGSGNVLGHGKTDFVIHNSAGAVVVGEVGSGGQAAYTQVAALGSEWAFHGVGDFLGDGHADVLIQNTAGAVVLGEVSGGQTSYSQIAALGPEWAFKGVGDFNGDGKADFLIENGSGAIVMGEVGQSGQAGYSQVGALGPEWSFKEVGAFLGDGKTGFLIESSGGAVVVGELTNGQASYTQIAALGPEWSFVGAGDYLGEGHDQFLMQSTSGAVVVGDWSGGQIHYSQVAALGPEWHFHP